MNSLILVVVIIFISISIISFFSFYSTRSKKLKIAKEELKNLKLENKELFSNLNEKEKNILKELYKKKFINSELLTYSGKYSESTLVQKSRGMTTRKTIRYIGDFEIRVAGIYELEIEKDYIIKGAIYKGEIYVLGIKEGTLNNKLMNNVKVPNIEIANGIERILNLEVIRNMKIRENIMFLMPVILFGFGILPTGREKSLYIF